MFHAYFLIVFVVLFPKGGIKAGGIPLTWGYLYLALSSPLLIVIRLLAKPLRARGTALAAAGMLLPMQIVAMYALLTKRLQQYGVRDIHGGGSCHLSMAVSTRLPTFF